MQRFAALLATTLAVAIATPAVAQTPHNPTVVVRGTLRMVMASVLQESSTGPAVFFVLTPAGQKDDEAKKLLVGSVARTLMGLTPLNQALGGLSCNFTLTPANTGGWYTVTDITACAPAT
jgi:hypothetical protein